MPSTKELYTDAKRLIPGGSNLFSKRGELHAPDQWPQYYKSAKGCEIIGMDDHSYLDFSGAGVGACILGYADPDVDTAVIKTIHSGSTSALLGQEEVELARMLTHLHPWAQQVRFARSGGEAIAVAIRIAQAKTRRVGIDWDRESYHGWQVNNPITKDSHFPWDLSDLSKLQCGAIIVEPRRLEEHPELLQHYRSLATEYGAVLIFDEISSGFRFNLGGSHLQYKVNPDVAVFSKAISNGYPMAAVIGTEEVMSACNDTFISSTTWSERIGPTAAIATIEKLWANDVFEYTKYIGELVKGTIEWEAKQSGLDVKVIGPPQMLHFQFANPEVQTLYTQMMLDRGFLAGRDFYPSYAHKIDHCERFAHTVREVFPIIQDAVEHNSVSKMLRGPVAESGIKR